MADVTFKLGLAVAIQSGGRGTVDPGIAGIPGSGGSGGASEITEADGAVLGDRESGEGGTGISIPSFERVFRELATLGFTRQPSTFLRTAVNGLTITVQRKGNGATWNGTDPGAAKPPAGIDALYRMAGLSGANGGSPPEYVYTPGTVEVGSILLHLGDPAMSWVLMDCTASRRAQHPPGDIALDEFSIEVGSVSSFQEDTWWGFDYGAQASTPAPVVQGVGHAWGTTRDFGSLEITAENEFEDIPRSNLATGIAKGRTARDIGATGTFFLDDADRDYEYQQIILQQAPTDELSFTVGTPATGNGDTLNAYEESLTNPETRSASYAPQGEAAAANATLVAVDDTEDGEYALTFK